MLVDLTPIESEKERCTNLLKTKLNIPDDKIWKYIQSDPRLHEETGIYWTQLNFGELFFEETKNLKYDNKYWDEELLGKDDFVSSYGVADNIDQIKEYYNHQIEDLNNKYFIAISPIFQEKEHAGEDGGWRWHKWGPYIGTKEPKCEYLYDEPEIDKVVIFELYEIS
jgi:hypothetical protein